MKKGYIKIWRKTTEWTFSDKPLALALWVWLLMLAKHRRKDEKPIKKIFKNKIIEIKDGQLLTGRRFLSEITGISEATVEKYLNFFEKEKQIIQQKSNRNRLITILNWESYQGNNKEVIQQPIQQSIQQPIQQSIQQKDNSLYNKKTHYKNIKKERIREDNIYVNFEKLTLTTWNSLCNKYPTISRIKAISPERRQHLKQRFNNKDFVKNWPEVIKKIPEYPFLLGNNDRKWTISFDWLIKNDTNYLKVLEGKYKKVMTEKEKVERSKELWNKLYGKK